MHLLFGWIVLRGDIGTFLGDFNQTEKIKLDLVRTLKVSKSQKQLFLKFHCPKNELGQNFFQIFWGMEFPVKMLLRFTDL